MAEPDPLRALERQVERGNVFAHAVLGQHANRAGEIASSFLVESGDLVLLRAPAHPEEPSGPLHSVAGPDYGTRFSISMRMEGRAGL